MLCFNTLRAPLTNLESIKTTTMSEPEKCSTVDSNQCSYDILNMSEVDKDFHSQDWASIDDNCSEESSTVPLVKYYFTTVT